MYVQRGGISKAQIRSKTRKVRNPTKYPLKRGIDIFRILLGKLYIEVIFFHRQQ